MCVVTAGAGVGCIHLHDFYLLFGDWQNEEAPLESLSEKKSAYVDFRPDRPMIYRLSDTLKVSRYHLAY